MTGAEKIDAIMKHFGLNGVELTKFLGFKHPQIIYEIRSGKTKMISPSVAERILERFPEISKSWLLADDGDMLGDSAKNQCVQHNVNGHNVNGNNINMDGSINNPSFCDTADIKNELAAVKEQISNIRSDNEKFKDEYLTQYAQLVTQYAQQMDKMLTLIAKLAEK